MSERRKRKSFWDVEEEVKQISSVNDPSSWSRNERQSNYEDRGYGTISASKSIDKSGRSLWEPDDENSITLTSDNFVKRRYDVTEAKEASGFSRFYKKMSPGFDGTERDHGNRTFDDDQSHFRRYPARDRSRSRGKTSDRSRSRSLGRGRGKERGSAWSRSRSRSNGSSRGQTRSCSPVEDYKRHSYSWSDRSRVPDKSSQSCRDFVEGSCRRGSQCRFVHPSTMNYRGRDRGEDDPAESWRNRAGRSHMLKLAHGRDSESERQYDASDSYRGRNEPATSRSRNAFPCKDFMKGNCRWADTCKLSRHVASGDSFGKTSRVRSFDRDIPQQSVQYGKPICKFFAAGKCDRNNCRFSHEDQKSDNLEARATEVIDHHKSKWSDDAMRMSVATNAVGWGDTSATNTNSAIDITNGILTLDKVRNSLQNSEWEEKSFDREKQSHPFGESGRHDRETHAIESIVKDKMVSKPLQPAFLDSYVQNTVEVLSVQQNTLLKNTIFSNKTLQQSFSSASHIQPQHHEVDENDHVHVDQLSPGVFEGEESSKNSSRSLISSGSYLRRNDEGIFLGHSLVRNESIQGRNMLYPMPSNEIITDLNAPEVKIVSPLCRHDRMLDLQMSMKSIDMLESKAPHVFPNLLNNKNSSEVTNLSAIIPDRHVAQVIEKPTKLTAQKLMSDLAQVHQVGEVFNSEGPMPSCSDALVLAPLVNTKNLLPNPVTVTVNVLIPMENGRDNSESEHFASGTEQNSLIHVKHSSPLSDVIIVGNSMFIVPESETLKQEEVIVISEDKVLGEESKDVKKGKSSDTLHVHGKSEELNNNKDEKGMRMFKNALIEFVKEILKPTWKEGRMSRDVHKTVVKKVVDKVIGTIQVDHIPKTQEKAEHYLSGCKPKITKLVQAYVDRCRKKES